MANNSLEDKNSEDLAKIRTEFAMERTYLAVLRTSAIFIGISLLLSDKTNMKLLSVIIALFSLIITIISMIYYIKKLHTTNILVEKTIPIFYSVLIIIILLAIIINNGINYIKNIKK